MRQDLTFSKNFTDYLGAFWSSIFDQGALGGAVGGSSSEQLVQAYVDLVEMINGCSVQSSPVFHRENLYPVRIKKSELLTGSEIPVYGGGGYFGAQPEESIYQEGSILLFGEEARRENSYYIRINDTSLKSLGAVGLNKLFEPSVVMMNGVDFTLRDGTLYLKDNPFSNELFPKRVIDQEETGQDEEIIIWFSDVDIEKFALYRQFGFIFTNFKDSSQMYKDIIMYVFSLVAKGSSFAQIESFLSAISGSPIIREPQETVEQIKQSLEGLLVVTDKNTYLIDPRDTLRTSVVAGAILYAGNPLTDTVNLVDTNNPEWWKEFESLPLTRDSISDEAKFLSFPNQYSNVQYGPELIRNDQESRRVRFQLIGKQQDIDTFWRGVDQRSKQERRFAGQELFLKYGAYDSPEDYFDSPVFKINPAEVLASDLAPGAILPIRVKLASVRNIDAFFDTVSVLKSCCPVHLMIYLFISTELQEILDLNRTDSQSITQSSIESTDLVDLLAGEFSGDVADAWNDTDEDGEYLCKTPEAVAFSISPGIQLEQFDLSDPSNAIDNVYLKQRKKCSV